MSILYLECNMGAAGDMLMAALYELCTPAQRNRFLELMHNAGIEGLALTPQPATRCGIRGTQMQVSIHGVQEICCENEAAHVHAHGEDHMHDHEHAHHHEHGHDHHHDPEHAHDHDHHHEHTHGSLREIQTLLTNLLLPDGVKQDALEVFQSIAQAESHVHGVPMEEIHFHEVGTMDALADVTGVCLLMYLLAPQEVLASSIATGSGMVRCAHGLLPVPAPATALLLEGIPTCAGPVETELCTPTGAALLRKFVTRFGTRPPMQLLGIGYGMGTKDFAAANCVRAFFGEADQTATTVTELSCNVDDMTPEALAYATEVLLEQGALDVYTQAIGMKKGRAATKLSVLCHSAQEQEFARMMLMHTTTLGVRVADYRRFTLPRTQQSVMTQYGEIRIKMAQSPEGDRAKPEYDDVAQAARKYDVSFATVYEAAVSAWHTEANRKL